MKVWLNTKKIDMLMNRVDLFIAQAVSCFLSGLCEEIQCAVRMFRPASLHEAYCLAKLQEATFASIARRTKPILGKLPTLTKGFSRYRGSSGGSIGSNYPGLLAGVLLLEGHLMLEVQHQVWALCPLSQEEY